jgi:hypothetical protein
VKGLDVIVIASEAWQSGGDGGTGLPRFARNDGIGGALFLLNPDVDLDYLERRIREESFGDYGIEDIRT